jgi:hypothetical protein
VDARQEKEDAEKMTPQNIPKKKPAAPPIIGRLFGKKKAPTKKNTALFGNNEDDDDMPSFYGKTEDEGDSFNTSYYEEGTGGKSKKQIVQEKARLEFLKYLSWLEYGIVVVELFLIIYTVLVLLGIAPIF